MPRRARRQTPDPGRRTGRSARLPQRTATGHGVWARYRDNGARHLVGIARALQARLMHTLRHEHGFEGLRPSFGPFLSLLWLEERPLASIAGQLAISRQACTQLANLTERTGYVERRSDPQDRRSKQVRLTRRGRALVEAAVAVILEVETEYAALVGRSAYRGFARSLAALYRGLRIPTHENPALTAAAGRSIGVLPLVAVRIQHDLMEATGARGHRALKMSYAQVLPLIGAEGGRIHEIARIAGVSRQAIGATSRDLEARGYLRREPDPRDRRGAVLRLTPDGVRLIRDSVAALDDLDRDMARILGRERFQGLRHVARKLYLALHIEQEIFETGSAPGCEVPPHTAPQANDEIARLAARLRSRLGAGDTLRLAALLAAPARTSTG